MATKSYQWHLYGPGVFKSQYLDAAGRHTLVAVGADFRELARVPVSDPDQVSALTAALRAWIEDPTHPLPPGAVVGPAYHSAVPRRRWSASSDDT